MNGLGFLYLISDPRGLYKIGRAKNPRLRLAELQTGASAELSLEHTLETDLAEWLEKKLHAKFEKMRVVGEWFSLNSGDIQWIKSLAAETVCRMRREEEERYRVEMEQRRISRIELRSTPHADPAMKKVKDLFEKSGKTLEQLGLDMGYPQETARQSAWQFMKTNDPRLSMLRRFARAIDVPIEELVQQKGK